MSIDVKICGLTDEESLAAAVEAGAAYVGLVFFEKSPRYISAPAAAGLLDGLPEDVRRVGLFVDPSDDFLAATVAHVRLDLLQLHGAETPDRVDAVSQEFGVPVMKAVSVASAEDIQAAKAYDRVAERLLFDAKPPAGSDRPGGNAVAFDWALARQYDGQLPWLLAGGLKPSNVVQAIAESGAKAVDVSSGVEAAPGQKDPELIRAFIEAAENA